MILDKTGTLTYGRPALSDELYAPPFTREAVLPVVAAIETLQPASAGRRDRQSCRRGRLRVTRCRSGSAKKPGSGLHAQVGDSDVLVTSRSHAAEPVRPAAQRVHRPGMRRPDRRPLRGDVSVPRRAARREPRVRRSSGPEARVHARAARLRRPGGRSATSGRLRVDCPRSTRARRPKKRSRSSGGKRRRRRRCSSATASTTRRR